MIIGGLDVGTTGCKVVLYDETLKILDTYYKEYDVLHQSGLHEIDFNDVRSGVFEILADALKNYKIDALGVTSFGETFAMLDENDNILAPSMLYTDPRGSEECKFISDKIGEDKLTLITGVKPHPMYSISKIFYNKRNNPGAYSKCKRILLGEDFIVYTLTGNAIIDYSLAARTGAFDIENKCWIKEVFDAIEVDSSLMSVPVEAGTKAGVITDKVKKELNIDYDITVVSGCHDQVAAMIGSGVFETTQAMDGTGTVECIPVILDKKPSDLGFYEGGYSVVPYIDGLYACYALCFTGGATLKWFRDNFAELEHTNAIKENKNVYARLDNAVKDEPTGILVLPHFSGAATPYMDDKSTAAFTGITLETTKYDLYKALMEGTSYEMLHNFNTMKSMTGDIEEIRATGGGASSDAWLQIKADILGMNITALSVSEAGSAGTALLAAVAMGMEKDVKSGSSKMVSVRKVFSPDESKSKVYAKYYEKYSNMYNLVKNLRVM